MLTQRSLGCSFYTYNKCVIAEYVFNDYTEMAFFFFFNFFFNCHYYAVFFLLGAGIGMSY